MPRALAEYSRRWIRSASEASFAAWPCCACQYCITMAMLAAPQPSFSCFTKGTSSQMPGRSAANNMPQTPSSTTTILTGRLNIGEVLPDSNNDQDERGNGYQNNDQIAIAQGAGGEVRLRFVHP